MHNQSQTMKSIFNRAVFAVGRCSRGRCKLERRTVFFTRLSVVVRVSPIEKELEYPRIIRVVLQSIARLSYDWVFCIRMFAFFLVRVTPYHPVRQLELRAVRREPITEKVRKSANIGHHTIPFSLTPGWGRCVLFSWERCTVLLLILVFTRGSRKVVLQKLETVLSITERLNNQKAVFYQKTMNKDSIIKNEQRTKVIEHWQFDIYFFNFL